MTRVKFWEIGNMRGAPLTYDKPERRANRAQSHFCREAGSTMYVPESACPYCDKEGDRDA